MASYVVTGPLAVAIVNGRHVTLGHGAPIPLGADEAHIEHLLAVGLIEEIPADAEAADAEAADVEAAEASDSTPPADPPQADPVDLSKLDLAGLRDLAAQRGIDLAGVTKAADIRAAITAAQA